LVLLSSIRYPASSLAQLLLSQLPKLANIPT
jgi:hypothetical protein